MYDNYFNYNVKFHDTSCNFLRVLVINRSSLVNYKCTVSNKRRTVKMLVLFFKHTFFNAKMNLNL